MDFFSHYNPPHHEGEANNEPSLTQQEYRSDCDVNNMIRRAISGDLSVIRKPVYLDVLGAPDNAHDVANRIAEANTIWHDMPDRIRQTYGSPEALLEAIDREVADNKSKQDVVQPVSSKDNKVSVDSKSTETSTVEPAQSAT